MLLSGVWTTFESSDPMIQWFNYLIIQLFKPMLWKNTWKRRVSKKRRTCFEVFFFCLFQISWWCIQKFIWLFIPGCGWGQHQSVVCSEYSGLRSPNRSLGNLWPRSCSQQLGPGTIVKVCHHIELNTRYLFVSEKRIAEKKLCLHTNTRSRVNL